ncbi:BON domain-containing protein [bacterium]|nr:BON domain-containing protein [bacterium]
MKKNDQRIKHDIEASIEWDVAINNDHIGVEVTNGWVRLYGSVPTYRSKLAAEDNVWATKGVKGFDNEISVKYLLTSSEDEDLQLKQRIGALLSWNTDLVTESVSIEVDQGHVSLIGFVPQYWQKLRIADLISGLENVQEISNEIIIVLAIKNDDIKTAQAINDALIRSDFLPKESINITVNNGVVTLDGEISTTFAKWRIKNIANNTNGVIEVLDRTEIRYKKI